MNSSYLQHNAYAINYNSFGYCGEKFNITCLLSLIISLILSSYWTTEFIQLEKVRQRQIDSNSLLSSSLGRNALFRLIYINLDTFCTL